MWTRSYLILILYVCLAILLSLTQLVWAYIKPKSYHSAFESLMNTQLAIPTSLPD